MGDACLIMPEGLEDPEKEVHVSILLSVTINGNTGDRSLCFQWLKDLVHGHVNVHPKQIPDDAKLEAMMRRDEHEIEFAVEHNTKLLVYLIQRYLSRSYSGRDKPSQFVNSGRGSYYGWMDMQLCRDVVEENGDPDNYLDRLETNFKFHQKRNMGCNMMQYWFSY